MLIPIEHEHLKLLVEAKVPRENAFFLAFKLSGVVFILFINVKMPTIVGILTFISMINVCSIEMSTKKVL